MTGRGPRFRAFAMECQQAGPWFDTWAEAEADALRMDGHRCPSKRLGNFSRAIPLDRLITKRAALYEPASALHYMPQNQR